MINKRFETIYKADIDSLITNEVSESRTLEYKEKLPGNSDDEKKEFLKDVSAFANTSGGDIIYGISEQRDVNGKTTGLPDQAKGLSGINADEQKRRLDSILQDGLDPRIPGILIEVIDGFTDGSIIIIRVPKSWNSPHMVVFKKWSRFYARNSAAVYQLDVAEIRSTFIASESIAERIRQFRSDRIAKIIANEMPIAVQSGSKIVMHMVPIASFNLGTAIDVRAVEQGIANLSPIFIRTSSGRYNFDGYLKYAPLIESASASYVQLFRNGVIEAVNVRIIQEDGDGKYIPSYAFEKELSKSLDKYLEAQQSLGLLPPIIVMLSLLGVRGCRMQVNSHYDDAEQVIDRDLLLLPEVVVEEYSEKAVDILRPTFDAVWQACGWERSHNYADNGQWIEKR